MALILSNVALVPSHNSVGSLSVSPAGLTAGGYRSLHFRGLAHSTHSGTEVECPHTPRSADEEREAQEWG